MDFTSARFLISTDETSAVPRHVINFDNDTESRRYVYDAAADAWMRVPTPHDESIVAAAVDPPKKRPRSPVIQQTQALFDEDPDDVPGKSIVQSECCDDDTALLTSEQQ